MVLHCAGNEYLVEAEKPVPAGLGEIIFQTLTADQCIMVTDPIILRKI